MTQRVKVLGSLTLRRQRSLAAVAHTCNPSTPGLRKGEMGGGGGELPES